MFKADQQVRLKGNEAPATVISGPHPTYGADRWLVRKGDGKVTLAKESELSAIADRRETVAQAVYTALGSNFGYTWGTASCSTRTRYLRAADAVLKALDARPLEVGGKVRILKSGLEHASVKAGDVLTLKEVGSTYIKTDAPGYDPSESWSFRRSGEGTGWERV